MSLIKLEDVTIGYDHNVVLDRLNLEIEVGDYLCILGSNGSGKSTLLKTMLGLLKPLKGTLQYGSSYTQTSIGYLPQQTQVQKDFPASVEEIVRTGCLNQRRIRMFYSKEEKQRALDSMKRMGIEDLKDADYQSLSGGQKQRVLLARALCATQDILWVDEPTAGLDSMTTQQMYNLLEKLNKEDNITIVMISHDEDSSKKYANKFLYLHKDSYRLVEKEDAYE